ncbi:MAG: sugar MFS transporter [Proteobacteria bacterium]|nr:sugar MFS transporter [Pseudomonadota bacterium]
MAFIATSQSGTAGASSSAARIGLIALTLLFFVWGFLTALNDVLLPHLRAVFSLTYAESALIQTAFFLAYFISSLPSSAIVARIGYKGGLAVGLVLMAIGALMFLPAASLVSFPLFLAALFVLGSGITLLQVAANPYVTMLGAPEGAAARLTLTQAFNSFGTTIAPLIGGSLILSAVTSTATGDQVALAAEQASAVRGPYLAIALALFAMAVAFYFLRLPEPSEEPAKPTWTTFKQCFAKPRLSLGVLAIFIYVGTEVSIGSFLINFITAAVGVSVVAAAHMVSFYWGGAMVGRFIGSFLLRRVQPSVLLAVVSVTACALIGLSWATTGYTSVYALIAVGLCNAIMFPIIFSLGVEGLGRLSGIGSSLLVQAIVGGAVIPLVIGALADRLGLGNALAFCIGSYLCIGLYGLYTRGQSLQATP